MIEIAHLDHEEDESSSDGMINFASEPRTMVPRFTRVWAALLMVVFFSTFVGGAAQANARDEAAEQFVQDLIDEGLAILQNDGASLDEKKQVFGNLVLNNADIPGMARFTLGKYRRNMSSEQLNEFVSLFEQYTKNFYETRLGEYGGEDIDVVNSVDLGRKGIVVESQMELAPESILEVNWKVFKKSDGEYIITDLGVAGIWMVLEQRSQFTSVIGNNGGNVDALLVKLREMVSSGEGAELPPPT